MRMKLTHLTPVLAAGAAALAIAAAPTAAAEPTVLNSIRSRHNPLRTKQGTHDARTLVNVTNLTTRKLQS